MSTLLTQEPQKAIAKKAAERKPAEQGKEYARPGFANDIRDTVAGGEDARPLGEILQTKRDASPTQFFNDPTIVSGKRTAQSDWMRPMLGNGNQHSIQTKLQVGEPNDKFEKEADQVAEKVVQSKSLSAAPTPPPATPPADEGTGVQPKRIAKKRIQRKASEAAPSVPKSVESGLESKKGKGDPLPPATQEHMESTIGADFSGVRVHTDPESVQMSQNLNAHAFTHGNDIYFNQGKYNPGTTDGDRLLAHELTHTVQQGASEAVPGVQASVISDIVGLADMVGINIPRIVDNIPGYTLFSYIIEYDILRDQRVEPNTRNLIRGLMGLIPFGNLAFEKLEEYGIIAKAVTWVDARVKALNLSTQRLLDAASAAWDEMSIGKGIDGNMAVLRKHFLPILNDVKTFATDAGNEFLKLVKEALLKPLVAYLETNSPAYKLATKVLHRKFPLDDRVEASMEVILEDFLKLIGKTTEAEQMKAKGTLKKAADWIDTQLARFFSLLDRFKAIVNTIWDAFSLSTLQDIPKVFKKVWDDFTTLLRDFLAFAAEVALKILELVKDALLSALASHVDKVPGFHLLTVILGKNPFTQAPVPRTTENLIRGFMGLVPGGEAKYQELKESGVVPRAAARIDALVARLGISWAMIVDTFKGIWNSLSINDLVNPIAAFQRIAAAFGEPVRKIFTFVVEVVKILVELVLALMNFPSNLVSQIIANVMAAFEKIKRDPVAFLMNLLRAVKKGFEQFFGNFLKHLLKGLQTWLFGELGTAGITPPPDITFKSVLTLAMQVLGITVDNILDRLALKIGKEKVERFKRVMNTLTGVWAFIKDVIERGPIAIWEYIQQKISNLWDTIVNGIKEWIMGRIIAAVTTKLLSLLDPTGIMPVINSFIAFFRAVQSFLDKLREMLEIVNTFTKGVLDIANGNLTKAADYLEKALADGVPVAIAFLANQVGLGKLGEKIKEMIGLARAKINEGIDWLIDKALSTGRALMDAIMGRGGAGAAGPPATEAEKTRAEAGVKSEEQKHLTQGKITKTDAEKAAAAAKRAHPVITSITVVNDGANWDYELVFRSKKKVDGAQDATPGDRFDRLLFSAMRAVAEKHFGGFHTNLPQSEQDAIYNRNSATQGQRRPGAPGSAATTSPVAADQATVERINQERLAQRTQQIERMANTAHQALARIQIKYSAATLARLYPQNTFIAGEGTFFVDRLKNNYIYPNNLTGGHAYFQNVPMKRVRFTAGNPELDETIDHNLYRVGPVNEPSGFDYNASGSTSITLGQMQSRLQGLPNSIKEDHPSAMFLAAMVAETSRHSISQISSFLLLDNPDLTNTPAFQALSMTRGGTDPRGGATAAGVSAQRQVTEIQELERRQNAGETLTKEEKKRLKDLKGLQDAVQRNRTDPRLGEDRPKIVTDMDLRAAKGHPVLGPRLTAAFQPTQSDDKITEAFVKAIERVLGLTNPSWWERMVGAIRSFFMKLLGLE